MTRATPRRRMNSPSPCCQNAFFAFTTSDSRKGTLGSVRLQGALFRFTVPTRAPFENDSPPTSRTWPRSGHALVTSPRVLGAWCRIQPAGRRIRGAGYRVPGDWCWVEGEWCQVQSEWYRVQGECCRVPGAELKLQRAEVREQGAR
jgi:hypothetical protein